MAAIWKERYLLLHEHDNGLNAINNALQTEYVQCSQKINKSFYAHHHFRSHIYL